MKLDIDKFKTFFFDFDGVIVDSVHIKAEAFAELYRPFGEDVASKVIAHHLSHGGMDRFTKIHHYHKNFLLRDIQKSEVKKLANKFSRLVEKKILKAPFVKGALVFLKLSKEKDKMMFVISGTPEDEIRRIVSKKGLGKYFTDVKGSPAGKKENMKYLLKKYEIDKSECIYFGDAEEDMEAAADVDVAFEPINYFDRTNGCRNFLKLL